MPDVEDGAADRQIGREVGSRRLLDGIFCTVDPDAITLEQWRRMRAAAMDPPAPSR